MITKHEAKELHTLIKMDIENMAALSQARGDGELGSMVAAGVALSVMCYVIGCKDPSCPQPPFSVMVKNMRERTETIGEIMSAARMRKANEN